MAWNRPTEGNGRTEKKAGTWQRKNKVHSEDIARKLGVKTECERILDAGRCPPKELFPSKAAWLKAVEAHRKEFRERVEARKAERAAAAAEREEKRRRILEEYGFDPSLVCISSGLPRKGARPLTPEEREGWRRFFRAQERAYCARHREKITAYNTEYRRRRRKAALELRQKAWTAEEWAKWNARLASKARGTPAYVVREVTKLLAKHGRVSEDEVTERLIESGGVEFLVRGAEAVGRTNAVRTTLISAAARAVAFFIDPDGAVMFPDGWRD